MEQDGIPEREEIIEPYLADWVSRFRDKGDWMGGVRYYENMPLDVVQKLMKLGFLDPKDKQNLAPSAQRFVEFMKEWKKYDVRAHGYEVSNQREDVRVTIEGLMTPDYKEIKNKKFLDAWRRFNRKADELTDTRSWWD